MLVKKQFELYHKRTGKSRATFFRERKRLGIVEQEHKFLYYGTKGKICYFCSKKAKVIHHIDMNRKNNEFENIIPLCRSCHNKIHRVLLSQSLIGGVGKNGKKH